MSVTIFKLLIGILTFTGGATAACAYIALATGFIRNLVPQAFGSRYLVDISQEQRQAFDKSTRNARAVLCGTEGLSFGYGLSG